MTATVNLALDGLPNFTALARSDVPAATALAGRIHIGPDVDYIERAFDCAKYGRLSERPWLEAVIPSLSDSTLAPAGKHVMSIYLQWAPYRLREGDWDSLREPLGDLVVRTLAEYAPDLPRRVLAGEVITPLDPERTYWPHRRPDLPWRAVAGPDLHDAPGARLGAAPHANSRSLSLWRRHASRRGLERRPWRPRRASRPLRSYVGRSQDHWRRYSSAAARAIIRTTRRSFRASIVAAGALATHSFASARDACWYAHCPRIQQPRLGRFPCTCCAALPC